MIYAGICVLGIAYSTLTIVTMLLLCLQTASTSIAAIILMTAQINLTENEFRGRVYGILQSFGVLAMPISTLLAGIIGEFVNVSVLFMFAGFWVLLISAFAWFNPHLRNLNTYNKQQEQTKI